MVSTYLGSMAYPCMALEHRIQVPKCGVGGVCSLHPKNVLFTPAGDPAGTDPLAPWGGWLGEWVVIGGSLRPISCTRCPNCHWAALRDGSGGDGGGNGRVGDIYTRLR